METLILQRHHFRAILFRELSPVRFGVSGYDDDPRGLFHIPEVRDWCTHLYRSIPGIFLFLDPDTIAWFFLCIADIQILTSQEKQPEGVLKQFLDRLPPEQREEIGKQHPGSFLETAVKFLPSSGKLIEKIWDDAFSVLQRITTSQQEFDSLANQFVSRFKQGLPKMK